MTLRYITQEEADAKRKEIQERTAAIIRDWLGDPTVTTDEVHAMQQLMLKDPDLEELLANFDFVMTPDVVRRYLAQVRA